MKWTLRQMNWPVLLAVVLLQGALQAAPSAGARTRPNVVMILADDQGWGDLSVHGNCKLQTPHVDSLARDGTLFERFFVCPVCSPTRAEVLTGRYHPPLEFIEQNGGELTLSASKAPGKQVIDVRYVQLTLLEAAE